jgi:Helitron helicase-like domain at N-terminus
MHQHYLDAMAVVVSIGKPDLFITFTCNPQWPEIQKELYPGQRPEDRPDIVARVFKLYLKDLLKLIIKLQFFGPVIAYVYSI